MQSDVVRKVKSGEVDFGVVIGPFSADDLLSESLMTDSFCVVSRDDHPLAAQKQVAWTDLEGQQLVMLDYASGSRPIIDAVMQEYGVSATVVQELGHSATVFGLVEAGIGVSVLPWLALPLPAGASLVARPLVPRAERTVELVRRRDRSLSPAAEAVWGLIRQLPGRAEDLSYAMSVVRDVTMACELCVARWSARYRAASRSRDACDAARSMGARTGRAQARRLAAALRSRRRQTSRRRSRTQKRAKLNCRLC